MLDNADDDVLSLEPSMTDDGVVSIALRLSLDVVDGDGSKTCLPACSLKAMANACLTSSLLRSCRRRTSDNARSAPVNWIVSDNE